MWVTEGPLLKRAFSAKGITAASHYFVMDWVMVWKDVVGGMLIAGALAAWVPHSVWQTFFLSSHPVLTKFWGPLVGPSSPCCIRLLGREHPIGSGAVERRDQFGGVIAFIFADLIVLPIVNIYRKYFRRKGYCGHRLQLLYRDGCCCTDYRISLPAARPDSRRAYRRRCRGGGKDGLYYSPEYSLHCFGRISGVSVQDYRRGWMPSGTWRNEGDTTRPGRRWPGPVSFIVTLPGRASPG